MGEEYSVVSASANVSGRSVYTYSFTESEPACFTLYVTAYRSTELLCLTQLRAILWVHSLGKRVFQIRADELVCCN